MEAYDTWARTLKVRRVGAELELSTPTGRHLLTLPIPEGTDPGATLGIRVGGVWLPAS